eukprot:Transcript_25472.p1 GENE.Transcript_25472~~Transcript_25472.p1  ORF type:complete len:443 (-),score=224.24 Transcript_25472:160-1488(-)
MSGFIGSLARRISAIDLDELFSYQTKKEVRMLDRRLGYLCWGIRLLVWGYIIGFVFIANEGYTQQETAHGHVLTTVEGSTYSMSRGVARSWDAVDASRPSLENGALFIATQVLHTQHQVMGNCTSPSKKCSLDADCEKRPPLMEGKCSAGMCWEMQWCPAQSETQSDSTDTHTLEGADGFTIWFKAAIQFTSLDAQRIFSTMSSHLPVRYAPPSAKAATAMAIRAAAAQVESSSDGGAAITLLEGQSAQAGAAAPSTAKPSEQPNQFAIRDLLELAGTTYDMVKSTGCVLSVSLEWNCYVDDVNDCVPTVHVQRLDLSEFARGFSYQTADHYTENPADPGMRDLYTFKGVRLLLSSRGVGKKLSVAAIMLQLSSLIALLWMANYAADLCMLYVLPERKHYRTYKQERTPDFSDLRNKIAEVEGEKKKLRERKNRFAAKLDDT